MPVFIPLGHSLLFTWSLVRGRIEARDIPPLATLVGADSLGAYMVENLFQQVYALVRQVPSGRVTTYGQLARLLGDPRMARTVGWALATAPADVPCHRVVDRLGRLSDGFSPCGKESHRFLLEEEGVPFLPDGQVDLPAVMWYGPEEGGGR